MKGRGQALAAIVFGLAIVVLAQRLTPVAGPPLYDGVVVEDPYRWLSPPSGFSGGAQGAKGVVPVDGAKSPDLAVGTQEQPPQVQIFAGAGYLVMPPGTTSLNVSIDPVQPTSQPTDGVIAGNVYRISLTNQNGATVGGQSSGGVTIVLRGPPSLPAATVERLSGGTWTKLQTDPAGTPHMFTAVVTDFGDYALVAPSGWVPASQGPAPPVAVGPAAPASTPAAASGNSAPGTSAASSGGSWLPIAGVVAALVLVVVGGVVWLVRPRPAVPRKSERQPRSAPPARVNRKRPPRRGP